MERPLLMWFSGVAAGLCISCLCTTSPCPSPLPGDPSQWPPLRLVVEDIPVDWAIVVDKLRLDFPGIEIDFPGGGDELPPGMAEVRVVREFRADVVGEAFFWEGRAVVYASSVDRFCVWGPREQGLANTIAHEYGHLLGWVHTEDPCSVMLSVFQYDSCLVDRSTEGQPPPIFTRRDHGISTISEGEGVPGVSPTRVCN